MNLKEIVAGIKYKPGWRISLEPNPFNGTLTLLLAAQVTCAYDHTKTVWIQFIETSVNECLFNDEESFLHFVFGFLLEAERHECAEFFEYRGVKIYDPHK